MANPMKAMVAGGKDDEEDIDQGFDDDFFNVARAPQASANIIDNKEYDPTTAESVVPGADIFNEGLFDHLPRGSR